MARKTRLASQSTQPEAGEVRIVRMGVDKLHPTARAAAMILARGDRSRIRPVSEMEALID